MSSLFGTFSRRIVPLATSVVLAGLLGGCGGGDLNQMVAAGFGQTPYGTETEGREVDVKARGPLVLPPDYNLPQPQDEAAQTERLGANWPTDPEVLQKQQVKERNERLAALEKKNRQSKQGRARVLAPTELDAWGKGRPVDQTAAATSKPKEGQIMKPQELKSYGGVDEDPELAGIPPEQLPLPPLPQ